MADICETCCKPRATGADMQRLRAHKRDCDCEKCARLCWQAWGIDGACVPPQRVQVAEWWEVTAAGLYHRARSASDAREIAANARRGTRKVRIVHVRRYRVAKGEWRRAWMTWTT